VSGPPVFYCKTPPGVSNELQGTVFFTSIQTCTPLSHLAELKARVRGNLPYCRGFFRRLLDPGNSYPLSRK